MSDFEEFWGKISHSILVDICDKETIAKQAYQAGRESMREEAAGVAEEFADYEEMIAAFVEPERIEASLHIAKAIREIE